MIFEQESKPQGYFPDRLLDELVWCADRRKIFVDACVQWRGFMLLGGHQAICWFTDPALTFWGNLELRAVRSELVERLWWAVELSLDGGYYRRSWGFDDLEAAVHHFLTWRADRPVASNDRGADQHVVEGAGGEAGAEGDAGGFVARDPQQHDGHDH